MRDARRGRRAVLVELTEAYARRIVDAVSEREQIARGRDEREVRLVAEEQELRDFPHREAAQQGQMHLRVQVAFAKVENEALDGVLLGYSSLAPERRGGPGARGVPGSPPQNVLLLVHDVPPLAELVGARLLQKMRDENLHVSLLGVRALVRGHQRGRIRKHGAHLVRPVVAQAHLGGNGRVVEIAVGDRVQQENVLKALPQQIALVDHLVRVRKAALGLLNDLVIELGIGRGLELLPQHVVIFHELRELLGDEFFYEPLRSKIHVEEGEEPVDGLLRAHLQGVVVVARDADERAPVRRGVPETRGGASHGAGHGLDFHYDRHSRKVFILLVRCRHA